MNKKITLLILSAYLSTSIVPTVAFAEENLVLLNDAQNDLENNIEYNLEELRDENDNYKIAYNYLKEYYSEYDCYLYKGQDFIPTFILSNANINKILSSKDESFVLDFNINGNSFDESPSVLSGLSKEFYDTYSSQIYRWVYYNTNLGDKPFSEDNVVSFPLESKDLKSGDTVYLYTTSNLENGKSELVSKAILTKDNVLEEMGYGQITFNTNLDVSDRTFFLTTSEIKNDSNDSNEPIDESVNNSESNVVDTSETIRDDYDNYRLSYSYLKDNYNEDDFYLYKGQDFIPQFILKNSNLKNILNSQKESFVLNFDINGKSFNESTSVLSGLSKEFYNRYSSQVYRWVHYKSNLGSELFKEDNTIEFPLENKDFNVGDTVYLYTTSNLKSGKVELIGEKKLTSDNIGQVSFNTKLDVSDRTFFLTKSKVELTAEGELPFSGGIPQEAYLVGGIIMVTASGYVLLNNKKKKDDKEDK